MTMLTSGLGLQQGVSRLVTAALRYTVVELGACDIQTDRQTDGLQRRLVPCTVGRRHDKWDDI